MTQRDWYNDPPTMAKIRASMKDLDGTTCSAVQLLSGLSCEDLTDVGGFSPACEGHGL